MNNESNKGDGDCSPIVTDTCEGKRPLVASQGTSPSQHDILTFNISAWYNALTIKHKTKLARIINQPSKIINSPQTPLTELDTTETHLQGKTYTKNLSSPRPLLYWTTTYRAHHIFVFCSSVQL